MTVVVGVDGCSAGWVAVWFDLNGGKVVDCRVEAEIASIAAACSGVIAVDTPIGLLDRGTRECDHAARKFLPGRASCVFAAPIRPVLPARSQREASAKRRRIEGKGVTLQAFGITPKIIEVDALLRTDAALQQRMHEMHPEVSFAVMNGGTPIRIGKKTVEGRAERLRLLERTFGAAPARYIATAARPEGAAPDDILDAFAAAWTAARIHRGTARAFPPARQYDGFGLPMNIVA